MLKLPKFVAAAVQAAPVFLDTPATVEKAVELIREARANGADIIAFPEVFIPGYPYWSWITDPVTGGAWFDKLARAAITEPGPEVDILRSAARDAGIHVVIGINERSLRSVGTLYNTLLYFAPDGAIVGRHRKLMPTGGERTVWGYGDGSTLGVVPTPFGVVGGLICWENYMPLARAAMYAQGVEIYLAPTWDNDDTWIATLQHIAKEGRCYVLGVAPVMRGSDVPEELRRDTYGGADDWMSKGFGTIVAPGGAIVAGPVAEQETLIYAEVDPAEVARQRQMFDPVGHYSRPDVFSLHVDTSRLQSVTFG